MSHNAEKDADLTELVAVHTPDLVRLAPDGVSEGEHYYCVECGVVPADEPGAAHVARIIIDAGYRCVFPPAEGDEGGAA